jgi:hypothetical protein
MHKGLIVRILVILAVALLVSAIVRPPEVAASGSRQEGPNRAAIVVRFSEDNVVSQCVSFSEPAIDGEELLVRSGLNPGFASDGALCSIQNAGCPANDCFCRCPFPECEYWAFYQLREGAWQYSNVGAAWSQISNGTVQAWSWGPGNWVSAVEPPAMTFEQICQDVGSDGATVDAATSAAEPATPVGPSIPEPMTLLILAGGVAGVAVYAQRARR